MLDFSQKHTDIYLRVHGVNGIIFDQPLFVRGFSDETTVVKLFVTQSEILPASSIYCGFLKSLWQELMRNSKKRHRLGSPWLKVKILYTQKKIKSTKVVAIFCCFWMFLRDWLRFINGLVEPSYLVVMERSRSIPAQLFQGFVTELYCVGTFDEHPHPTEVRSGYPTNNHQHDEFNISPTWISLK